MIHAPVRVTEIFYATKLRQAISLALEEGDATGALELMQAMIEHGAWPRRGLYAAVLQAAGRGA